MARAIMLQGTGSDVGKSVLVAGLCRVARRRGLSVRPFKPQNMSNNAAVAAIPGTTEMGEIGRAQWLQALACGVAPTVDMNPVLIKPESDMGAQLVVQGLARGSSKARDYQSRKGELLGNVLESFSRLGEDTDLVIVEGAGSPAEINLRARDIANMGFATRADVPVVLVGDIDRGGVIAALAGTHLILDEEDRRMIVGTIINKFRGDISLFDEGLAAIERFTGWRSFGVVPWLADAARLPPEDSVTLARRASPTAAKLRVAVPMLSRIANFDDLDPLSAEPDVEVVFVPPGERLPRDAGLIVIPGSKSTIADLAFLRRQGWADDIAAHRASGGRIVGLCGGYQMLGRFIDDPSGIEGAAGRVEGLGLLDIETLMQPQKAVREVNARSPRYDAPVTGYEIHIGRTGGPDCARPVAMIGERPDGAISEDGRVSGTYIHGLFESDAFRSRFLRDFGVETGGVNHREQVEAALDDIAAQLETHLDCDALLAAAR
ncbi:cobyric acid synthase [Nitratireductor pacificus]|uniref:Cobyric acid synthase n=1 Tax=Nitratireductor pacificus pht-3B TaxID=391937 RepID=K2LPS2_9HYPH|nr:cobyric acid synthase [Nitratireductor pacificus]EKF19659.1 cobyric acid synthase [Nitratireductor pacificus pht-3B]